MPWAGPQGAGGETGGRSQGVEPDRHGRGGCAVAEGGMRADFVVGAFVDDVRRPETALLPQGVGDDVQGPVPIGPFGGSRRRNTWRRKSLRAALSSIDPARSCFSRPQAPVAVRRPKPPGRRTWTSTDRTYSRRSRDADKPACPLRRPRPPSKSR